MTSTTVLLASLALTFLFSGAVGRKLSAAVELESLPVPISRPCPSITYDAVYDLKNNVVKENENVQVVGRLSGRGCDTRGVLKLALASAAADPNRRRVLVDLFFSNPSGYTFNLGDSSTNDGWSGDANTQRRDAEVFSVNTNIYGYLSDEGGSGQSLSLPNLYNTRLTLIAGDGHLVWLPNNHNNFNYHFHPHLFALNGQSDSSSGGPNYDLYLGMNQVMTGRSDRRGSGLCKVGIKFLPEY